MANGIISTTEILVLANPYKTIIHRLKTRINNGKLESNMQYLQTKVFGYWEKIMTINS